MSTIFLRKYRMRITDLNPRILRESFSNISVEQLGIKNLVDQADSSLTGEAADALEGFVGVPPDAQNKGMWGGIMQSAQLEDAYSPQPSERGQRIRASLEQSFRPVQAALRRKFGDTIRLYRAQTPVGDKGGPRHTLSWTSDPRVAAWFAGVDPRLMKVKPITDQAIQQAVQEYNQKGKVTWRGKQYVRTDEPTNDPDLDPYYYHIFDSDGDMITDGDDLEEQFREDQTWITELLQKRDRKLEKVLQADIPVNSIIWITDRAGQSEFILHNQPGRPGFVTSQGQLA